jgi:putative ABC transport system permease protein
MRTELLHLKDSMRMAFFTMRTHKMRSFLTVLGVLVGVAAVIGMVAIVQGLNKSMAKQIESLGANVIYVSRFEPRVNVGGGGRPEEERKRKYITFDDAMAIKELCPAVEAVSPEKYWWQEPEGNKVKYRDKEARHPDLAGVMPEYAVVNNCFAGEGRFITESDMNFKTNVCVLGMDVAETLFPHSDPIGKEVLINNDRFTVIGVAEKKPALLGISQNNYILIPYTTFRKIYSTSESVWLSVKPKSKAGMQTAIDQITELLRRRRGVHYNKENDFAVFTQDYLMEMYHNITGAVYLVMLVISSIALLVGGVGVMNIMLVSVTERTREIGIRKALGARRRNILWQFLIEAMTLTGSGGVLGILVGAALGIFVGAVTPLSATISPWSVIVGFSFSVSVGLFFGIYPASRAAKLDPITALRYE